MLFRTLGNDKLGTSYLFEGTDASGLRDLALVFAASIFGASPPAPAGNETFERVMQGNHPDVTWVERDKATVISVAKITEVLERAHTKPLEGERQVFIIDPADAMEPEGIARYLKTLEEPPPGSLFFLLSTQPERLPATVLSRVCRVRLPPLPESELRNRLREDGIEEGRASDLSHYAGGSLRRARVLARAELEEIARDLAVSGTDVDAGCADASDRALKALTAAADAEPDADTASKRQVVRRLLVDVLYVLSVGARDVAAGRDSDFFPTLGAEDALALLDVLERLRKAVHTNVTPQVVLLEVLSRLRTNAATSRDS